MMMNQTKIMRKKKVVDSTLIKTHRSRAILKGIHKMFFKIRCSFEVARVLRLLLPSNLKKFR